MVSESFLCSPSIKNSMHKTTAWIEWRLKIKMLTRAVPMNRNIHEEAQSQAEVTRLIYLGEPGEGLIAGLWEMSPCPCLWGCRGANPGHLFLLSFQHLQPLFRSPSLLSEIPSISEGYGLDVFLLQIKSGLFKKYLFLYLWLHWVFVASRGLSVVAASGGYSSLWCTDFSLRLLLFLKSTGSRVCGLL